MTRIWVGADRYRHGYLLDSRPPGQAGVFASSGVAADRLLGLFAGEHNFAATGAFAAPSLRLASRDSQGIGASVRLGRDQLTVAHYRGKAEEWSPEVNRLSLLEYRRNRGRTQLVLQSGTVVESESWHGIFDLDFAVWWIQRPYKLRWRRSGL